MSLFVVRHEHKPEACPAGHPEMGPMLIKHLSKPNAQSMGIDIRSEAVVDGAHTLFMILDAEDESKVQAFMTPFAQAGEVEIMPANVCEVVVERGRC